MKRTSLATAKARLNSIVRDTQRRRTRTVITHHGKPVAAIVPVESQEPATALTKDAIDALFAAFGGDAPNISAVEILLADRR